MPAMPVDEGQKIKPADRDREAMLAAMKQASEKWGAIGVNGNGREKALAVEIAAEHGFQLTNPDLQGTLARQKIREREEKQAAREEKRLGFVEGTALQSPAQKTDAEIAVALNAVRENTEAEARREVKQAVQSAEAKERPFDGGGEDHAFRMGAEAAAAQRAERSVESNPNKPIPVDINQSREIEHQRQIQQQLLEAKDENRRAELQKQKPTHKPRQS